MSAPSSAAIAGYHAHIYYAPATRQSATVLRTALVARFTVRLGRWRDEPVGPHPAPMFQVAFAPAEFAAIVPWLMLNRRGHAILVHPETGDALADHRDHPLWLGAPLALDFSAFRRAPKAGP